MYCAFVTPIPLLWCWLKDLKFSTANSPAISEYFVCAWSKDNALSHCFSTLRTSDVSPTLAMALRLGGNAHIEGRLLWSFRNLKLTTEIGVGYYSRGLFKCHTWKPVWPSGPARGCYSLGPRFESVCQPSSVWWSCVGQKVKVWGLSLVGRLDPGTHLKDESERTLDLPTRRSCQGTSPWLSTE